MKLFLHYLRSKALKIGAFLLFALLFLVSFRLYHLPLAAVWYPSALCAALGLVILLLDFRRVRQRHLELQQILKSLPTLPQTLPQPQAVLEEDYRALTRALLAQQRTLETQLNSRYQDMLDYYTLWAHQIKTPIASMRLSLQQEDTPKARQLLQEGVSVQQAGERSGFSDNSHFIRTFGHLTGITPGRYAKEYQSSDQILLRTYKVTALEGGEE